MSLSRRVLRGTLADKQAGLPWERAAMGAERLNQISYCSKTVVLQILYTL